MSVSMGNPIEGNFELLRGLFTEEHKISGQIREAEERADAAYKQLGFVSKILYPVRGAAEVDAQYKNVASLKQAYQAISAKIERGFAVLKNQEMRAISNVCDKVLRGGAGEPLAQFERLYQGYDQLRASCNNNAERDKIEQQQADLVFKLLKSGIVPRDTWIQGQQTFKSILSAAITKVVEISYEDTYYTLLHSVCKGGRTDIVQLLCDHVDPKVFEEELRSKSQNDLCPIDYAVREGHSSVIRTIAGKYPRFHEHMKNCGSSPIGVAIESGNIDLIKALAETLPREEFAELLEVGGEHPLNGESPLAWAIEQDDKELLQIMEEACPETVAKYRNHPIF